jgi:hypothetical protein
LGELLAPRSSITASVVYQPTEIISVVIFGFLKSYSIIDYVNPVNVNFKDPGCCTTPDAVKTAALYFFNLSVISSSTSNPSNGDLAVAAQDQAVGVVVCMHVSGDD